MRQALLRFWDRLQRVLSKRDTEWMLWCHSGPGRDQIGRLVNFDGKTGKVIDGTMLEILVEWTRSLPPEKPEEPEERPHR